VVDVLPDDWPATESGNAGIPRAAAGELSNTPSYWHSQQNVNRCETAPQRLVPRPIK
jgi:hypothetical protein